MQFMSFLEGFLPFSTNAIFECSVSVMVSYLEHSNTWLSPLSAKTCIITLDRLFQTRTNISYNLNISFCMHRSLSTLFLLMSGRSWETNCINGLFVYVRRIGRQKRKKKHNNNKLLNKRSIIRILAPWHIPTISSHT